MTGLWKWLTVFALGVAELWAAAPFGALVRLDPLPVFLVATLGTVSGGVAVALLGEGVRRWMVCGRNRERIEKKQGWLVRLWFRHGVVGWGVLAPLLVGSPLGAAIGLLLGAPARRLVLWLSIGGVLWSAVFSLLLWWGGRLLGG